MAQAAQILDFLHGLPLLTPRAKAGVLGLLRKTLLCADEDFVATTSAGISIFRDVKDVALNRIYRVSGTGFVEADPQVVFDLLCNMDLIPEWDMLYKGAKYLTFARDPSGRCEVGDIHVVYGLPGVSNFVSDRDFILRMVRVWFPNGMQVLYCTSMPPDEQVEGDPGKRPCTIRGHMWDSGYVVVPAANGCCVNITLQVDPKGWIPTSVVNFSLEAIPLNIDRIRAALQQIDPELLAQLPELNRHSAAACQHLPALHTLGQGGAALHAAVAAARRSGAAAAAAPCSSSHELAGQQHDSAAAAAAVSVCTWSATDSRCGGASSAAMPRLAGDSWGVKCGAWGQGRQGNGGCATSANQEGEDVSQWHDAESTW